MTTLVQRLVEFGRSTGYDALPPHVAGEARRLLLDSAGCAIGALGVEKCGRILRVAEAMAGPPEVTVIGTGRKLPASSAAFANGELINALDYDSLITPPGHVSPYVIPAILGAAEVNRRSGRDLIAALAVAHEVSFRLGRSTGYYRDVKPGQKVTMPAVSGYSSTIFGGTLGAALMRGLSAGGAASAMGLAGHIAPVQTMAKWGHTVPGSDDKYLLSGWIGQAEVLAVLMAEQGYQGDVEVLEGDYGFWRYIGAGGWKPEALTDGLGQTWGFPDYTIYKPWPHCRTSNTVLDCLQHLIDQHGLKPDEIERVDTYWDSHTAALPLWNSKKIVTLADAVVNTGYAVSMVVHGVDLGPAWYDTATLTNPKYLAFIDKVTFNAHPKFEETLLENGQTRIGRVDVVARGRTFTEERRFRKGSPATPETRMSDAELADKFRINAARVLPADRTERIIDTILNLEDLKDVTALTALW